MKIVASESLFECGGDWREGLPMAIVTFFSARPVTPMELDRLMIEAGSPLGAEADRGLSPFLGGVLSGRLGSGDRRSSRSSRSRDVTEGARSLVGDLTNLPGFRVFPLHWGQDCSPLPVGDVSSPLKKSVVHTLQWTISQYSLVCVLGTTPAGVSMSSCFFTWSRSSANGRIAFTPPALPDEIEVVVISSAGRASSQM